MLSCRDLIVIVLVTVAIVLVGILLPNNGYFLRIATLILMFAGMSSAWNLIGGYANQVSLGHAAFFGLGAYVSTLLFIHYGISPWLGMLFAGVLGALASIAVGLPTFRLRGHYYALATLAVAELFRILALYFRGVTKGAVGLSVPYVSEPSIWTFQYFGNRPYFFIAAGLLAIAIAMSFWLERGPLGYRLRALRNSHAAAEVVGVNTTRAKLHANLLSAALMAMYGTFYAQFQYFIDPNTVFGFWTVSIKVAMIAILGGVGTVWGPLIGACILVTLGEWTDTIFTGHLAALSKLLYAIILIVLIVYRPGGLLSLIPRIRGGKRTRQARSAPTAISTEK
jgi:branched-chain amino acid transport system permease protein